MLHFLCYRVWLLVLIFICRFIKYLKIFIFFYVFIVTLTACASGSPSFNEIVLVLSNDYAVKGADLAELPPKEELKITNSISISSLPAEYYSLPLSNDPKMYIPIESMMKMSLEELVSRKVILNQRLVNTKVIAKIQRVSHTSLPRPLSWVPYLSANIVFEIQNDKLDSVRVVCNKDIKGDHYSLALRDVSKTYTEGYSITMFSLLLLCLDEALQQF